MGKRDRWIMVGILAVMALYFFAWDALYLYAAAAAIYLFSRGKD